jgi:hypothetical protein
MLTDRLASTYTPNKKIEAKERKRSVFRGSFLNNKKIFLNL